MIRQAALVLAGIVGAALAVRQAVVNAYAGSRPALAATFWANHPRVTVAEGMARIGASVRTGKSPPPAVTASFHAVLSRDPLRPEPFLVAGTAAFAEGRPAAAERLLREAVRRDAYAPAARFLLADLYLRQGRDQPAFTQIAYLMKRLAGHASPLLPGIAEFARRPDGARRLAPLLHMQPALREPLLDLLASDPESMTAILQLAGPPQRGRPAPPWQERLLSALIERQDYGHAEAMWAKLSGLPPGSGRGLYNARFEADAAPPPFNWRYHSSSAGVAELQPGGGLRVLYYGREDAVLASQLMLLSEGRYRLRQESSGSFPGLSWTLVCLPAQTRQESGPGPAPFEFIVSAGCAAQRLELRGQLMENPANGDVTIRSVALERLAS